MTPQINVPRRRRRRYYEVPIVVEAKDETQACLRVLEALGGVKKPIEGVGNAQEVYW